ncbi:MAG: helix-turn-helix domain-containing protein [Desulfitobacteriaceae bacterium]
MAGEGQVLRSARENKRWELADAEEATKIRVRYLQAMEDEDYRILPGTAYVKGFLRTYAKHLDVDPEQIVGLYKASAIQEAAPALQGPLTPMKTRPFWLRPAVALLMSVVAITVVIAIAHWTQKPEQSAVSQYSPSPLPTAPQVPDSTKEAPPPSSDTQTPQNPEPIVTPTDSMIAKLVFTEDCWLSVKVDGQQTVEGYFTAGTTKEITASNKIEFVTIGNAGGVTITLNGKPVPSLGTSRQVKRNIVFDKAYLNTL